jgi:type I restriction enzyme R subunit
MELFEHKYGQAQEPAYAMAAEPAQSYAQKQESESKVKSAALILHDAGTKDEREKQIDDFKAGKIDLLFIYNRIYKLYKLILQTISQLKVKNGYKY